jgi:hypothetical protein
MRVLALIATIPARRKSCERLLGELARQSRMPDGIILVLDGYAAPTQFVAGVIPIVRAHWTGPGFSGAGQRWLAHGAEPDDILVCLDDDTITLEAPWLVQGLMEAVETTNGAAAVMGRSHSGKFSPPMTISRGSLIYAAGCGLTVRARDLDGLNAFATALREIGGPDALGPRGDDDALVSAYLWKRGVKIVHAATGNIYAAAGTRSSSQTAARMARREAPDVQKRAIAKLTGWPWPIGSDAMKVSGQTSVKRTKVLQRQGS